MDKTFDELIAFRAYREDKPDIGDVAKKWQLDESEVARRALRGAWKSFANSKCQVSKGAPPTWLVLAFGNACNAVAKQRSRKLFVVVVAVGSSPRAAKNVGDSIFTTRGRTGFQNPRRRRIMKILGMISLSSEDESLLPDANLNDEIERGGIHLGRCVENFSDEKKFVFESETVDLNQLARKLMETIEPNIFWSIEWNLVNDDGLVLNDGLIMPDETTGEPK